MNIPDVRKAIGHLLPKGRIAAFPVTPVDVLARLRFVDGSTAYARITGVDARCIRCECYPRTDLHVSVFQICDIAEIIAVG